MTLSPRLSCYTDSLVGEGFDALRHKVSVHLGVDLVYLILFGKAKVAAKRLVLHQKLKFICDEKIDFGTIRSHSVATFCLNSVSALSQTLFLSLLSTLSR